MATAQQENSARVKTFFSLDRDLGQQRGVSCLNKAPINCNVRISARRMTHRKCIRAATCHMCIFQCVRKDLLFVPARVNKNRRASLEIPEKDKK
jgi:hypothetical protein